MFDAYPDLKIILGHLGEGVPFAMYRLNDHSFAAAKRRVFGRVAEIIAAVQASLPRAPKDKELAA